MKSTKYMDKQKIIMFIITLIILSFALPLAWYNYFSRNYIGSLIAFILCTITGAFVIINFIIQIIKHKKLIKSPSSQPTPID